MSKNTNNKLKEELNKVKNDFKSIKTIYRQIPNMLTTSRILAVIPINILFFTGDILNAFIISCVAFSTDWVDGLIARKLHIESKLGADLDALCDKLLIGGIAIPMIALNPIMIINIILEGLISIPNIAAKKSGKEPKSSWIGKIKTWILSLTVLAGYIAVLNNLTLSPIQSLLAILPATGMQITTLNGYIKRNNKIKNIENQISESDKSNIQSNQKDKKEKQREIIYGPATLEELKKLKQELIVPYQETNYSKTKNRLN